MNKIIRDGFTVDERNLRRVNRKMDVFLNSLEMGNLKEVYVFEINGIEFWTFHGKQKFRKKVDLDSELYKQNKTLRCLGIVQHPKPKNYIIVIELVHNRDLHYFLNKKPLSWLEKLHEISIGFGLVYRHQIIHHVLHSNNNLINIMNQTIADLGISKPINELPDKNLIYEVIPYVAPKVLKGEKFTQALDIYSFGMIIWEVISGSKPFSDHKHDEYLILDILNGLLSKILINTLQDLIELM
ncbi:kinase-like domain-containing protein [Gigaspora rosea]|uniref:Kinase-like domain-containing protein n=1 Tax=Gigaspora rosea TaxID=44941 RepID=A0A397V0A1_9GLOM|nr:kinase-like domain-containing protein [Gigaspora rosea]